MTTVPAQTAQTPTPTLPGVIPTSSVPAAALRAAVAQLARVIPARSSNPLLVTMLLRAQGGQLTLSGTNLSVDWSETIAAPDLPDFEVLASARRLAQFMTILGKATDVPLGVDVGRQRLELYAEEAGTLLHMPVRDTDMHPLASPEAELNQPTYAPDTTLPAGELAAALRSVMYACSRGGFQAVFRGICLHVRDGMAEAVASDGYRVALHRLSAPVPYMVIPRDTAQLLIARLGNLPAETQVHLTVIRHPAPREGIQLPAERVRITAPGIDVIINCIADQFPDIARVLPTGNQVSAEWARKPLIARLRALQIMVDRNANERIDLVMRGTLLTLTAEGDDGSATSTLDLSEPIGGAPAVKGSYNLQHLLDAAVNATGDTLRIGIKYHDPKAEHDRVLEIQSGNTRAVMVSLR